MHRKGGAINVFTANESRGTLGETRQTEYCGLCKYQLPSKDLILVPLKNSSIGILWLKRTFEMECRLDPAELPELNSRGEVLCIQTFEIQGNKLVLAAYESGDWLCGIPKRGTERAGRTWWENRFWGCGRKSGRHGRARAKRERIRLESVLGPRAIRI